MSDLGSNIDKLFKDGLEGAKVNPPNSVFNSIKRQINTNVPEPAAAGTKVAAKSLGITGAKIAIVATVAISGIAAFYWLSPIKDEKEEPKTVVQQKVENSEKLDDVNTSVFNDTIIPNDGIKGDNSKRSESKNHTQPDKQRKNETTELWVIVEEDEPVERVYVEEAPTDFAAKYTTNRTTENKDEFVLTNCGLVGAEIEIKDNIAKLTLANTSGDVLPIEINWGDAEPSRVVLENELVLEHNYYVLNNKDFTVSIRAIGKNCVQNVDRVVLVKNNSLQQEIVVPNIFTPNNDGLNDSFYVEMPRPKDFVLRVISPMKQIVYESKKWNGKWSGDYRDRQCDKGMYTVILKYKYSGDLNWKSKTSTVWLNRN